MKIHISHPTAALVVFASLIAGSLAVAAPAGAADRCSPCIALLTETPARTVSALRQAPPLSDDSTVFVGWVVRPAEDGATQRAHSDLGAFTTDAGPGTIAPLLAVEIETPRPLLDNVDRLEAELAQLAEIARAAPPTTVFQLRWRLLSTDPEVVAEYAFLVKRAAAAVSGAQPGARLVSSTLPSDAEALQQVLGDDLAAYLDGLTFASAEGAGVAAPAIVELDPGTDVLTDPIPLPAQPLRLLALAAEAAGEGVTIPVFDGRAGIEPEQLQALALAARELAGDVSFDPYSTPGFGAASEARAWSFVRGSDLGLRVVVDTGDVPPNRLELTFSDPLLTSPKIIDPASGEPKLLFGGRRSRTGYRLELDDPSPVFMLAFERNTTESLAGVEGVEERVMVAGERQMPVSEILRRLQAFEDAQARRLDSYTATNETSLRFQLGTGVQALDVTFRGAFFFRQGSGFDWAWDEFYVNGVKWRRKKIPEIPLIQPEKATSMPLEISFTKEYTYRLRGTAVVEGRDCWVVDFEPAVAVEPGESLYQGTVWVDRELYGRVRTRAIQLGLEGDVISNEETITYTAVDGDGQPIVYSADGYWLPLHLVGQQLFSILSGTTVVEREVTLSGVTVNPPNYDERLEAKLESDVTMVRDTERGMRYLIADKETGERVVQEELDPSRLFVVGGAFYDRSLDTPIPLAGVNWLNFDWRDTGAQVNFFFAGPLLLANIADPDLFGSKFNLGIDAFALAIQGTDSVFRNGREAPTEDVDTNRPNIDISIGRPIGSFFKIDFEYSLGWSTFSRASDTADNFVVPSDHLSQAFELTTRYNRGGWRLRAQGSYHLRSEWKPWGFETDGGITNPDYDPDKDRYALWGAGLAKIWHLPKFMKVGAEVEYLGGDNLDRFSKYQFGFFSDVRVHGYRSDRVRAEEAWATHLTYGFEIGKVFRVDLAADAAWATDDASGLDRELLAGIGLVGTTIGPWGTIVNFDIGTPVAGPDSGISAFLAFLKLFR